MNSTGSNTSNRRKRDLEEFVSRDILVSSICNLNWKLPSIRLISKLYFPAVCPPPRQITCM